MRSAVLGDAGKRTALLTVILASGLLLAMATDWPNAMRFTYTAFEDRGGTLILMHLLKEGLKPGIDFYYPYGLLPLILAHGWFAVFGYSVIAELLLMACCNVLVAWGLARFATAIRVPRAGIIILAIATPLVVRYIYLNVTHAFEAVLLVHALAEHARGRLRSSFALVTACVFVKPTMAYFYGLLLAVLITRALWRRAGRRFADWRGELGPAVLTGAALVLLLVAVFGWSSLVAIQLPKYGRRSYELMNCGFFFGIGKDFWRPRGANLKYYLGTFAGTWLVLTGILVVGGVLAIIRRVKGRFPFTRGDELLLVLLTLHLAFVCLFYGVPWDWVNYGFVLVLGVLTMVRPGRAWAVASVPIVGLLLLVHAHQIRDRLERFRTLSPSLETGNLWASAAERDEWRHVLALTSGRHPLIFKTSGCAELIFPGFEGTDEWYVQPQLLSILPQPELARIRSAFERHRDIVFTKAVRPVIDVPPFAQAMAGHVLMWRGQFFEVYGPGS